ncbi:MAG: 7-carboxy-7-deazaguanine synthase QueE [Legionellales bacterium RIFCSPHIGHO2_12_FULL_37_14]|nr:MAG: 7-carboxy-7-deazaguanine synthase QueE [Legionellales bacterium RIFCSPHIGHO2_12_FULL_37_14]
MLKQDVRLTEIFYSIQGESLFSGCPTVFVRLTGCPLRCQYCDTAYAFTGGKLHSIAGILSLVDAYQPKYVCVTGGEPLAQKSCLPLLKALCDKYPYVSLETSGALSIENVDSRVNIVMDIKTPGSLESAKNLTANLSYLKPTDQIKFVLCNRADYAFAKDYIALNNLSQKCELLFSPSWHDLDPAHLAEWILQDKLAVRLQMQLHKVLWNDEPGR